MQNFDGVPPQQQILYGPQDGQQYYGQPQQAQHSQSGPVGAYAQGGYAKPPPPQNAPTVKVVTPTGGYSAAPDAQGVIRHNPNERFASADGCRDTIWAVLWVAQLILIIILAIYYSSNTSCTTSSGTSCSNSLKMDGQLWGLVILLLVCSTVFSGGYLWVVKSYPLQIINFTLGLSVVLGFVFAVILLAVGEVVGGIFMLLFAGLQLLWVYWVRGRIPFSATILGMAANAISLFPAMVYVSYGFIVLQCVWMIVWIVAASAILNALNNDSNSGMQGVAVFFLLLSFYWTTQTLKNIVHVTCSGTFASWYFLYPAAMPANPTVGALKRASWTSLGSVCLGSLIIAVLQTLRALVRMGRKNRNTFLRCCVLCILNCLESMIRYFNLYAFTHVAVYGTSYCDSAQSTMGLLKGRGWDLLINDQLISPVLSFGALLVGLLCAAVAVVVGHLAMNVEYWGWWAFAGFLIGFAVALCAMEVVESCVATLFVCFAEDPDALARTKPNDYNRLDQAFRGRMVEVSAAEAARDG